jgi:hypothetical protein
MGLTFSDTFRLSENLNVKAFFAPRGQSTEGPLAFRHRPTGMANPDAPLGHHVGQDVGHITSSVLGASIYWRELIVEGSVFNGTEPEPSKVDLPVDKLNSASGRIGYRLSGDMLILASAAYLKDPEPDHHDIEFVRRFGASLYNQFHFSEWKWDNALIWGRIQNYDHVPNLSSFAEEFAVSKNRCSIWGRFEYLQRTPDQLAVFYTTDGDRPRWVSMATVGYTHDLSEWNGLELKAGGSLSKYFLGSEFKTAYGEDPWAAKVFLQVGGMTMWP